MGIAGCARGWADRSAGFPIRKAATARGGWRDVVMGYDARIGSPGSSDGLVAVNGIRGVFLT